MTLKTAFPAPTGKAISSPDSRADLAGLVVRDTAGLPRAGVLPRHANAVVTSRASMGVNVAAFEAVVVRNGLPSFISSDGGDVVPIGAAPGANSRYDVVYLKQNEASAPFSDGNDNAVYGYVSSPAAPSPSLAAALALLPAGALPLASVLIPSTATTTQSAGVLIAQIFPFSTLTGGQLWFRTAAEMELALGFASGTDAYVLAEKISYTFNGTIWIPGAGLKRILYPAMTQTAQPSATILGSQVIQQKPYKQRVVVSIDGLVNINPSGTVTINVLGTAGLSFPRSPTITFPATAGTSTAFTRGYVVEIAAGTGSVTLEIQIGLGNGGTGIFNGMCTMHLQVEGEW